VRLLLFAAIALTAGAQVKLPPFTRTTLPNGARIEIMPRPGLPLVGFRVQLRGGGESEPADKAGLSGITAGLLRRGTAKRSADQFSNELDSLGGAFNSASNEISTLINAEFLSKDFNAGLELIADAVFHANFPEAEVKKLLAQQVEGARTVKDNPGAAVGLYFRAFFFGPQHPFGRITDDISLARITRDDIVSYHRRLYAGKNLTVIVAGDVEQSAASSALSKTFGAVPAGEPYTWVSDAPPQRPSEPRLLLVDKPDATQTYFEIGQPGVTRISQDRIPLLLLNTLFGGRFTSMLNQELRTDTGLTYGANSRLQQSRLTGVIAISTYTKTESTAKAIELALDILKRLHDNGVTTEQLASVKAYIKGLYPRQSLETTDQLATILGEIDLHGLNRGEVDDLFSSIDAVTLERANAVARKYYRTDNLTFTLLGNAKAIRESIARFAPRVTELDIKQPGFGAPAR
jgi:zinc protease